MMGSIIVEHRVMSGEGNPHKFVFDEPRYRRVLLKSPIQRAGGDGGMPLLLHSERARPAAPHQER
jgi:hypothetical protein